MTDRNNKHNILIVDDREDMLARLSLALRNEGYSISYARSGNEALGLVKNNDYDLILLDIKLEKTNTGFDVCRAIKQSDHLKETPVILMSAYQDISFDVKRVFDVGGDDFINKRSDDNTEMLARIKKQLEIRRLRLVLKQKDQRIQELEEKLKAVNGKIEKGECQQVLE